MPAILVELAFISNPNDVKLLRDNQVDFARAIIRRLAKYGGLTTNSVILAISKTSMSKNNTTIQLLKSLPEKDLILINTAMQ